LRTGTGDRQRRSHLSEADRLRLILTRGQRRSEKEEIINRARQAF
jgi:hypothetical protein